MKRYRRTAASQYLILVFVLVSVIGVGVMSAYVMVRVPFTDNFAIPWAAGRSWLLEGESPYASSVGQTAAGAIEESAFLALLSESQVLTQPLMTLVFYLPFSLMPYAISRTIWVTVLSVCVGLIGLLSIRLSGWKIPILGIIAMVFMLLFWQPSVRAILEGYLSPIIILLVLFGVYLILNEQDTTAGFILALTFSSFLTTSLILVAILIWSISKKRWSIITSFFSGLIFLTAISFLLLPAWFRDWASVLVNYLDDWSWIRTPLMDLAALLPGIASPLAIFLHAVIGIYAITLLITILGQSGQIFTYKMCLIFLFAYLLHPQGSTVLIFFVVPAMLMVFRYWSERWGLFGDLISWVLLLVILVGPWLLVYSDLDFATPHEIPLLYWGYPLVILLGMIWIRWWALKIPKLPYQS